MTTTNAGIDHIAASFESMARNPQAPTLPAHVAGTNEPIMPAGVAAMLHDRSTCPTRRDRIWAHVVNRTRRCGTGEWTVFATGLALPGLRRAAARAVRIWPHDDPGDIDAEVLAGFVTALAEIDLSRPRVCSRLIQAAFSAGRARARRHIHAAHTRQRARESTMPPPVSGHVDLVLARAVHEGVITRREATIIGATRIEDQTVVQEAATHGMTPSELERSRGEAEDALRDWITGQDGRTSQR